MIDCYHIKKSCLNPHDIGGEGITELLLAWQFKPAQSRGWLSASGVISLILAGPLLIGWLTTTVFFMGVIIGINLLLYGAAVLFNSHSEQRRRKSVSKISF